MARPSLTWDARARRYRDARGRFLAPGQALRSLERDLVGLRLRSDQLATDLRSGRISLEAWRIEMKRMVKHVHLGAATIAKGGRQQMTPADYGRVGQRVRAQYAYLEGWVAEIAAGRAPLDGRLTSRARLYLAAGRPTYVAVREADLRRAGFDEERSVLTLAVSGKPIEHCDQCPIEERKSWQALGTMVPLGDRQCGVSDKCRVEFRNSRTGEVVAA